MAALGVFAVGVLAVALSCGIGWWQAACDRDTERDLKDYWRDSYEIAAKELAAATQERDEARADLERCRKWLHGGWESFGRN